MHSCVPEFEAESRFVPKSDDGGIIEDAPGDSELSVTGVNGVKSEEHGRSDNSMISIATTVVLMLSHDLQYTYYNIKTIFAIFAK